MIVKRFRQSAKSKLALIPKEMIMKTATTLKLTLITSALLAFAGAASAAEVCVVDYAGDYCPMRYLVPPGSQCFCSGLRGVFYGVAEFS